MQVDTFIILFFYCIIGVYAMKFIYLVIVEEIVFTFVIDAATVYHKNEQHQLQR